MIQQFFCAIFCCSYNTYGFRGIFFSRNLNENFRIFSRKFSFAVNPIYNTIIQFTINILSVNEKSFSPWQPGDAYSTEVKYIKFIK